MHRLAPLGSAPQCWGGEVCRGSPARAVAGGEDRVLPWEEGCGRRQRKGASLPRGSLRVS